MRGGLIVSGPQGESVSFPTRKTGALLAILALKQGHAVPRVELAEILWPGTAPNKQLVSLRQAIRNLQVAMGESSPVVVRRDSARIDPSLVICPDLADSSDILLPEMTELWFEDVRRSEGSIEPHAMARDSGIWNAYQRQTTASLGLLDALEWASVNRPRECLRIARSMPELIESAPPFRLAIVLDRALATTRADDPLYGWGIATRGMTNSLLGHIEAAAEQFIDARARALEAKDRGLYVMSSFYLTTCQIMRGDHEEALATIKDAKRLRLENVDHYAAVRLRHGLGLALCHHGNFKQGLRELWIAHDESEERTAPYEHAYVTANLALFESTVGSIAKAKALIQELRDLPAGDSWRLGLTAMLAQAQVYQAEKFYSEAKEMCLRIIDISATWHATGVDIYASEILARQAHDLGLDEEAANQMKVVRQLRKTAQYGVTMWDRARLGPLASNLP